MELETAAGYFIILMLKAVMWEVGALEKEDNSCELLLWTYSVSDIRFFMHVISPAANFYLFSRVLCVYMPINS